MKGWDVPLGLEAFAALALLGLSRSALIQHLRKGGTRDAHHDRE